MLMRLGAREAKNDVLLRKLSSLADDTQFSPVIKMNMTENSNTGSIGVALHATSTSQNLFKTMDIMNAFLCESNMLNMDASESENWFQFLIEENNSCESKFVMDPCGMLRMHAASYLSLWSVSWYHVKLFIL